MKKSVLLLAAGLFAGFAYGQNAHRSVVFTNNSSNAQEHVGSVNKAITHSGASSRVTSGPGGSRWYDYVDSVFANNSAVTKVWYSPLNIWRDTTGIVGYTSSTSGATYYDNLWTSVGLAFDPYYKAWNDNAGSYDEIYISGSDAYSIDTVVVEGNYGRGADVTTVDTLALTFVYGDGSTGSDMGVGYFAGSGAATLLADYGLTSSDTMFFAYVGHDSAGTSNPLVKNVAYGTSSRVIYKFPLSSTDTTSMGGSYKFALANAIQAINSSGVTTAAAYNVAAANLTAMSITFIPGTTAYPAYPGQDTLEHADGTYKYGDFSPLIFYSGDVSGNPSFPPYDAGDLTTGLFKREALDGNGWGSTSASSPGTYIPNWGWITGSTGTGPSFLQYPGVMFHVNCATCYLIRSLTAASVVKDNSVTAYPNPATSQITISYELNTSADVKVTLTNMMGQVVATQTGVNGKAVFNTASIADGMYIYTLQANGERSTGHVVVAH